MMIGFGGVMRELRGCFREVMLGFWGRLFSLLYYGDWLVAYPS